jgi:hypothetical protein
VLLAANITPAAVFRTIELVRPTLLIDEVDTFLEKHEELRGVLNSGHTRDGCVIRTVGDDHEPREFSTWSPCAVAMIGHPPDTLADRSFKISMRRRLPGEKIDRLRTDRQDPFNELRRKLARFALHARAILENADPLMPPSLNDRDADNWRVLFAIAEAAGGDWHARAVAACGALNAGLEADDADTIGTTLLKDIRAVFKQKGEPEKLSSTELCQALADDEASPWAAFGRSGKPIAPPTMARLLKRFKIAPKVLRNGAQVWRGYLRGAFADAWARYLPPDGPPQGVTALQTLQNKDLGEECTRNTPGGVTPGDDPQVIEKQGLLRCNGSTHRSLDGNDESEYPKPLCTPCLTMPPKEWDAWKHVYPPDTHVRDHWDIEREIKEKRKLEKNGTWYKARKAEAVAARVADLGPGSARVRSFEDARRILKVERNKWLFRQCVGAAPTCDSFEDLLDYAQTRNDECGPQLDDAEVRKVAVCAWEYAG